MKSLLIAALLAGGAFSVSAQSFNGETYGQTDPYFSSEKSRAEVKAELRRARLADQLAFGEFSLPDRVGAVPSQKSRAEVLAELRQARSNGELAFGEFSLPDRVSPIASSRMAGHEVRQEPHAARDEGELRTSGETAS